MEKKNIINSSIMCFQLLYFNCIFSQLLPPPKALWAENWSDTGFTAKWIGPKGLYKLEVSNDTFFNPLLSGYPKYIKGDSYNVSVPSCGIYYYRVAYASPCDSMQISHYSNTIEVLAANLPPIGPNSWIQLTGIHAPPTAMPARQNHVVARVGKKIYVGMGYNGSCLYDWWEWDPCSGWTQKASLPANPGAGGGHPFVFVINYSIYVGGGGNGCFVTYPYPNVYKYNVFIDQWTPVAPLPSGRYRAVGTSDGTYGYVLGGYNGVYLSDLLRYNPSNNTWDTLSFYPSPPGGKENPFTFYYNGEIYWGTGFSSNGCDSIGYKYNISQGNWISFSPYPSRLSEGWAVRIDSKVFVTGGTPKCTQCTNQFYYYDINGGGWHPMAPFPDGNRNDLRGAAIANFIFMGFGHDCGNPINFIKDWWMYRIP